VRFPSLIYCLQAVVSLHIPETNTRYHNSFVFHQPTIVSRTRTVTTPRTSPPRYPNSNEYFKSACIILPSWFLSIHRLNNLPAFAMIISIDIRRINFSCAASIGRVLWCHAIKLSNRLQFEWTLSPSELRDIRNCAQHASASHQIFVSPLYERWFLQFDPNGYGYHQLTRLSLCLAEFPHFIGAITAKIKLSCNDIYRWSATAALKRRGNGLGSAFCSWPNSIMDTTQFLQLQSGVRFTASIEIIAMFDLNGCEVSDPRYQQCIDISEATGAAESLETPGYMDDEKEGKLAEEVPKETATDSAELQKHIVELQKQVFSLSVRLNAVQNEVKEKNGNHNNANDPSFKKWYDDNIQFPEYFGLFIRNKIDSVPVLSIVDDSSLQEIGIKTDQHRNQILSRIQKAVLQIK